MGDYGELSTLDCSLSIHIWYHQENTLAQYLPQQSDTWKIAVGKSPGLHWDVKMNFRRETTGLRRQNDACSGIVQVSYDNFDSFIDMAYSSSQVF